MQKKPEDLLLDSVHAVSKISPSTFLNVRYESLVATLQFIEATPEAAYADKALRKLFAEQNGVLDAHSLEAFFQIVGEVQFWMLAVKKEILLTRIPETDKSTPDFRMQSPLQGFATVRTSRGKECPESEVVGPLGKIRSFSRIG